MFRLHSHTKRSRGFGRLVARFITAAVTAAATAHATESLQWSDLPPLPDELGFGGPIVGVHGGVLIVAGGANFPDGPPWSVEGGEPGVKVWHDRIFVLEPGAAAWREAGNLPVPLGYAAVVSAPDGVYIIGGETFGTAPGAGAGDSPTNYAVADVVRLAWNATSSEIVVTENALPPLPKPSRYHAAALIDQDIYVTASHAETPQSQRLDSSSFWRLSLAAAGDARTWTELDPWPGPAREQMTLVAQRTGAADGYEAPMCLYLISGATWAKDADGVMDLTQYQYFADGYRYNPKSNLWRPIADLPALPEPPDADVSAYAFDADSRTWRRRSAEEMTAAPADLNALFGQTPRPAAAAPAIALGQSHILLFSGSSGRYVTLDVQDRPTFPKDILSYHTITDTWIKAGEMPLPVVTTSAVTWGDRIVIPSGETQPGIRTNAVQALTIPNRAPGFGALNYAVLIVYLASLIAIGIYYSRGDTGTADFFLAGGRIPWWAAGISIYATQLSAITFVSLPAVAYATNWKVYPAQITILLMAPIVVMFYLPFFRRLNVTTAYEYLEQRFNLSVRLFGSLSFITFQLGRMAVVVYLPALALSVVTGMNLYVCILIMGVLATLYTGLGGMAAVIWTDVLQVIVLWGGIVAALVIVAVDMGGVGPILELARADDKLRIFEWSWDTAQMATWLIFVGSFALNFAPYTTDQAVVQRYMTTKNETAAARSIYLNGFLTLPFAFLFFSLGTALYAYFKTNPLYIPLMMENDKIFPVFVAEHMPAGLSGLVIAGIFAASMSSLDSSIHSVATAFTTDFYRRFLPNHTDAHYLRVGKGVTYFAGIVGTLLTLLLATYDIGSLFFLFQKLLGLTSSGLVAVFMLGMFTRRANATGALTGAAASIAVLYYVTNYTQINFYLYAVIGIAVGLVVGYAVSIVTPASAKSLEGLTYRTMAKRAPE